MGLPVTTASVTKTNRLEIAVGQWSRLHGTAVQLAAISIPSGVFSARRLFEDLVPALALAKTALINARAVPGIVAFATDQLAVLGYSGDLGIDANATETAIDDLLAIITANASTIYNR